MAKVTSSSMTPNHVKAARALLGLNAEEFAALLPVGIATLRNFESGKHIKASSRAAIFDVLFHHGVQMENGICLGVRIVDSEAWAVSLKAGSCPQCGLKLPRLRIPKNFRQALLGGWTCENCGIELSATGYKLTPKG